MPSPRPYRAWCVMAGMERIVTPRLIEAFQPAFWKHSPALRPKPRGQEPVSQALAAGVTLTGLHANLG